MGLSPRDLCETIRARLVLLGSHDWKEEDRDRLLKLLSEHGLSWGRLAEILFATANLNIVTPPDLLTCHNFGWADMPKVFEKAGGPQSPRKLQPFRRLFQCFGLFGQENAKLASDARKQLDAFLAKHRLTWADLIAILAASAIPPPPATPPDDASHRYDGQTPGDVVENVFKFYAWMSEHVAVISTLAVCLTYVYTQFAVAPRVAFTSKKKWGTGKSVMLELCRAMIFRANEEALGTGAAVRDHLVAGPGSIALDELDQADADAKRKHSQLWNLGHRRKAKISLKIDGQKKLVSIYCLMFAAGFLDFLAGGQKSRAHNLEMEKYTEETKPKRDYYSSDLDEVELENVRSFLGRWGASVQLELKPPLPPGVIARDADNVRGLLAVARSFGSRWEQRAHAAITFLLTKEREKRDEITLCRHTLVILDMLKPTVKPVGEPDAGEPDAGDRHVRFDKDVIAVDASGDQAIRSVRLNRELKRLDIPDASWNSYRGPSGMDYEHPLRVNEQAALFEEAGVPVEVCHPSGPRGPGESFRGVKRSKIEAVLRKHETDSRRGQLRLITPGSE